MLDLLLKGGLVFDGTGAPPVCADIGIVAGRIVRLAPGIDEAARTTRDVGGQWIVPGFIDIHTHYDVEVEIAPGLAESVRHGVTSVVMGNCSLSLTVGEAPDLADIFLRVESLPAPLVRKWLAQSVSWGSPQAYLAHLRSLPLGPNVAPLLGHSALRAAVMGLERSLHEAASDDDLARMRALAGQALDAGCFGISVDMVHWHKVSGAFAGRSVPSHYADAREYRMLADLCRERDAVFQVTPNPQNGRSFLLILAMSTGLFRPPLRATVLSALDMSDHPQLWRLFPLITFVVNRLLGGNLRFQTLAEPFAIYADGPITPLFEEFAAGVELNSCATAQARRALWASDTFRARFRADWQRRELRTFHRDPARMWIVASPEADHIGRSVAEIAAARGSDATATLIDLLATHDEQLRWVACGANERPAIRRRLLAHRYIHPGFTDAGAHSRNLAFFDGALAVLREAVSTACMSPERAIARVTGEVARWFNLDAGELREGRRADLVLLSPAALQIALPAPVEIADPMLEGARRMVKRGSAAAVASVFIAGIEVVRDGEPLPVLGTVPTGTLLAPKVKVRGQAAVLARYRNRIDDELVDHPFRDYWDIFVFKHQDRRNVLLHCLAVLMMYGSGLALLITWNPWWFLLVLASQATGLAGHWLFERSHVDMRDVVFSWRASRCLNRMFFAVLRGRYWHEVGRVRSAFALFREAAA
ncbi:MAG: Mpo1-like protein [Accumulibacter sp.]|jgi:N-acyl-D-aspartate/D-glutamate deacylase|uniref:Mpo1-like protein n=1 Tax=Accumulibacter sp. TaxID=2053492 RepID=UPI002FC2D0B0